MWAPVAVAMVLAFLVFGATGQREVAGAVVPVGVDDYPYKVDGPDPARCIHADPDTSCRNYDWGKGGNAYNWIGPWGQGYGFRNCTDWVAWKLYQGGVAPSVYAGLGNGGDWAANARAKGLPVDGTPRVGDAASFPASTPGGFGHVAFVEQVFADGRIQISEYNWQGTGRWGTRVGTPAELGRPQFIHFGAAVSNDMLGPSANERSPYVGRMIHHPNGTVDYVATTGFRYWVPNGDIVNCLGGPGSILRVSAAQFESLPRNVDGDPDGRWADCNTALIGRLVKGSGPRVDYVAATGQRYYVPNGEIVNCLGGSPSIQTVSDAQFNSIPENPYGAWAVCSSAAIGRLIHHPGGTVDYMSAAHVRYWVPDGNTVNCLGGWGSVKNLTASQFESRPRNVRDQRANCNSSLFNRLVRRADGTVDYVSGSGERFWVPDGNTVTCLGGWSSTIFLTDSRFVSMARNAANAWADCGSKSRV